MVISSRLEWEDSPNRVQLEEAMDQPLCADTATGAAISKTCALCVLQRFVARRMNASRSTSRMVPFVAYVGMETMMNLITDGRLTTLITKPLGTVRT